MDFISQLQTFVDAGVLPHVAKQHLTTLDTEYRAHYSGIQLLMMFARHFLAQENFEDTLSDIFTPEFVVHVLQISEPSEGVPTNGLSYWILVCLRDD